jgi:hypothetical protein
MLIKEDTMKRLVAILALVVIVLPLATSAFADSSFEVAGPEQWYTLGYEARELYWDPYNFLPRRTGLGAINEYQFWLWDPFGNPAPDHPVDIWLWRPPTLFGAWNLDFILPAPWEWWMPDSASLLRRQSWPTYATTDGWGVYYAKFMMPRNAAETWYPCGFPCRWNCTFFDPIANAWEWHAPTHIIPLYKLDLTDPLSVFWPFAFTLYWPNEAPPFSFNWLLPDAGYWLWWWGETVHPVAALPTEGAFDSFLLWVDAVDPDGIPGNGDEWWDWDVDGDGTPGNYIMHWEYVVEGYFWKTTDLEMDWPADWPLICPWQ